MLIRGREREADEEKKGRKIFTKERGRNGQEEKVRERERRR